MRYITTIGQREYLVEVLDDHSLLLNGKPYDIDFASIGDEPIFSLLLDGSSFEAYVYPDGKGWQVLFRGNSYQALVEEEMEKTLRIASESQVSETAEYQLKSPMPGLVIAVPVCDGQPVQKGDVLVILESMKMQNELKAPRSGQVARLRVKSGDGVEHHQVLLTLV